MFYIAAAMEGFAGKKIYNIGFVRSNRNVSEGLTKYMKKESLSKILSTGEQDVNPDLWIVRNYTQLNPYSCIVSEELALHGYCKLNIHSSKAALPNLDVTQTHKLYRR